MKVARSWKLDSMLSNIPKHHQTNRFVIIVYEHCTLSQQFIYATGLLVGFFHILTENNRNGKLLYWLLSGLINSELEKTIYNALKCSSHLYHYLAYNNAIDLCCFCFHDKSHTISIRLNRQNFIIAT